MEIIVPLSGGLVIGFLAAMSPGPDTVLVLRSVAVNGVTAGIRASAGIGMALLVHAIVTLFVLFAVHDLASSILLKTVQLVGVFYLALLGIRLIRAACSPQTNNDATDDVSINGYFRQGFLTNLTNPKAIVFFSSVASQFINNQNVLTGAPVLLGIVMAVPAWFVTLSLGAALIMGRQSTRRRKAIDIVAGILFIALAAFGISTFFRG